MGLGDLGNAFLIVIIFALIHLFITALTSVSQFKKVWNAYKCNPAIMPFASLMGFDPTTTFQVHTRNTSIIYVSIFGPDLYVSSKF